MPLIGDESSGTGQRPMFSVIVDFNAWGSGGNRATSPERAGGGIASAGAAHRDGLADSFNNVEVFRITSSGVQETTAQMRLRTMPTHGNRSTGYVLHASRKLIWRAVSTACCNALYPLGSSVRSPSRVAPVEAKTRCVVCGKSLPSQKM